MYQIESIAHVLKGRGRERRPAVSRTVLLLGLTSLFTDVSSEMISTVLPLYMLFSLNLPPLQFGIVDGIYQGASALVRVGAGLLADRKGRHKAVAVAGYGISALCRIGLLLVGGVWSAIAGLVLIDRIGKGIRTAPRDAMISLSTPPDRLATAFGVHRAMDTFGAMLGPLLAFGLLALMPGAYDAVFVVSFCFGIVGLGVIGLLLDARAAMPRPAPTAPPPTLRRALDLLRIPAFRLLVVAGAALSLTTVSDTMLYLSLQRQSGFAPQFFPLLFVATALVFMLLAIPVGWLSDRIGRWRVFGAGYAALLAAYAAPLLLRGSPLDGLGVALMVGLLGCYYAATDGVLMAIASATLPEELRGSGLALLTTATSLARLVSSLLFGALWTVWSVDIALATMFVGLAAALLVTIRALAARGSAV